MVALQFKVQHFTQQAVALLADRASAVDAVEDVHDHIHGFIFAGDFLDVEVNILHVSDGVEAVDVSGEFWRHIGILDEFLDHHARPGLHEFGHAYPERIVLHLDRGVEFESLVVKIEIQIGERLRVAVEEARGFTPHDAVISTDYQSMY